MQIPDISVGKKEITLLCRNIPFRSTGEARIVTEHEQKAAATAFAVKWQDVGDEKQHTQTFWLELLQQVYGVDQPFGFITFEDRVQLSHTSFIDARIPETHVLIEQKSLGKDLTKPIKQSDAPPTTRTGVLSVELISTRLQSHALAWNGNSQ